MPDTSAPDTSPLSQASATVPRNDTAAAPADQQPTSDQPKIIWSSNVEAAPEPAETLEDRVTRLEATIAYWQSIYQWPMP